MIIRVLILEDRQADADLMLRELQLSQFEPDWRRVETEAEYSAHLAWKPDLILAAYTLRQFDAVRALEMLRDRELDIPFVLVSGTIGEEVAVSMMRRGATDYLLKDRLRRLGPAVRGILEDKKRRHEIRLAKQALHVSETRFNAFMNHNPALTFIKDEQECVVYMNSTCELAWGKTLADCQGKMNHQLWPAELAGKLHKNESRVLRTGMASAVVEEITLPNHATAHLLTCRFPFTDATGHRLLGGVSVDITHQIRYERELARALTNKEILLRELHHRVKNNLQVVSSLLSMRAAGLADPEAAQALQDTQRRVECMAMIHERLHNDDNAGNIDFREYTEALSAALLEVYGAERITLRLELEPAIVGLVQANPCALILNELLTNSLKHAFPDGRAGEIRIALSAKDDLITLTVADNGVGVGATKKDSMGLRIVDILTRQLDAEVKQESESGVSFTLTFRRLAKPAAKTAAS